ncbi:translation initiation factor IF-2 N-terminal domain-containing protein, partial [Myxococcota bacterium]|nr:translation initiation factor IF-2 N-terminal domain-containing protein [Myxococcota bacterium]
MSKDVRVLSIAKDIKLDVDDVIDRMREMGIEVNTKYSSVTSEQADRFKEEMERLERQRIRETRMDGGALVRKKVEKPGGVATRKRVIPPAPKAKEPVVAKPAVKKSAPKKTIVKTEEETAPLVPEVAEAPAVVIPSKRVSTRSVKKLAVVESPKIETAPEPTAPDMPKTPEVEVIEPVQEPTPLEVQVAQEPVEAAQPVTEAPVEPVVATAPATPPPTQSPVVAPVTEAPVTEEKPGLHIVETPQAQSAAGESETAQEKPKAAPLKKARVPHHSTLPGKPEASASPGSSLTGGKAIHKGGRKVEYSGPQLGPTGRFIVLPKSAKAIAAAKASAAA